MFAYLAIIVFGALRVKMVVHEKVFNILRHDIRIVFNVTSTHHSRDKTFPFTLHAFSRYSNFFYKSSDIHV